MMAPFGHIGSAAPARRSYGAPAYQAPAQARYTLGVVVIGGALVAAALLWANVHDDIKAAKRGKKFSFY
jgi:hypothetical protein